MNSATPGGTETQASVTATEPAFFLLFKKIGPLIVILAVTIFGWFELSDLASDARMKATLADYDKALTWVRELLGLAGILAGFLGVSAATLWKTNLSAETQAIYAAGGLAGILAGATLLNVGGWPIPAALAAMAIGTITILIRKTW